MPRILAPQPGGKNGREPNLALSRFALAAPAPGLRRAGELRPIAAGTLSRRAERLGFRFPGLGTPASEPAPPLSASPPTRLQRIPVRISGKMEDIKKDELQGEKAIEKLAQRLGLAEVTSSEESHGLSKEIQFLANILKAVDKGSINRELVYDTLDRIMKGLKVDWSYWDGLELYASSVQPVIDQQYPKDKDKALGRFGEYYQNLKNKGMDYEKLIEDFLNENRYEMRIEEAHVIFGYTTILFYKKLNALLRLGVEDDRLSLLQGLLNSALAKLPLEPPNESQKRAIDIPPKDLQKFLAGYKIGATVRYVDFLSAANFEVSPFWEKCNVRLTIQPLTARSITELAFGHHFISIFSQGKLQNDPHESLFPNGSEFRVVDVVTISDVEGEGDHEVETNTVAHIELEQTK